MQEELDNLATIFSDRFRICYISDQVHPFHLLLHSLVLSVSLAFTFSSFKLHTSEFLIFNSEPFAFKIKNTKLNTMNLFIYFWDLYISSFAFLEVSADIMEMMLKTFFNLLFYTAEKSRMKYFLYVTSI